MMRRKISSDNSPLRAILTETLPYELPVYYSNNSIYSYLQEMKPEIINGKFLRFNNVNPERSKLLLILFGMDQKIINGNLGTADISIDGLLGKTFKSFTFRIRKNEDEYRYISIPHPASQILVSIFYEIFSHQILASCRKSSYSVRYPIALTRYTLVRDINWSGINDDNNYLEVISEQNDIVKSYFAYDKYDIISKFYNSSQYFKLQAQFDYLMKTDIQNCFASVYTHSISWAIHGKNNTKKYIELNKGIDKSFSGVFDKVMQRMNDNETHGILVGGEVSRVFFELIMQQIDKDCCEQLASEGYRFGENYSIVRYMDDCFIFANSTKDLHNIKNVLNEKLYPYRFNLGEHKTEINSSCSVGPVQIFRDSFKEAVLKSYPDTLDTSERYFSSTKDLMGFYNKFATELDLPFSKIAGSSLSQIEYEERHFISMYLKMDSFSSVKDMFYISERLKSYVDISFHIYNSFRSEVCAVKTLRIMSLSFKFLRDLNVDRDILTHFSEYLLNKVTGQVKSDLTRDEDFSSLYLISIFSDFEVQRGYEFYILKDIYEIARGKNVFHPFIYSIFLKTLTCFEVCRDRELIVSKIFEDIKERIKFLIEDGLDMRSSELSLLVLDVLSFPHFTQDNKADIMRIIGMSSQSSARANLNDGDGNYPGVTDWVGDELYVELLKKRFFEVY